MGSIFTEIISGNIPGHFVWKDDLAVVIMTIAPIKEGHVLVIPRQEVDQWDDLPEETAAHLVIVAQKVTKGLKKAFPSERVGLIIAGLEVPHTHIHLIPVNSLADFDFTLAKQASQESLAANSAKLRDALKELGHREADL